MISLINSNWTTVDVVLLLIVLGIAAVIGTMMAIPWMQEVRYRRMLDRRIKAMHKRALAD